MGDGKGFLLVYSITDKSSFDQMNNLYDKICRTKDTQNAPIVLAGNKCDLNDQRQVSTEEGQKLAAERNCPFFETSAKSKINNEACFNELVREIRRSSGGAK